MNIEIIGAVKGEARELVVKEEAVEITSGDVAVNSSDDDITFLSEDDCSVVRQITTKIEITDDKPVLSEIKDENKENAQPETEMLVLNNQVIPQRIVQEYEVTLTENGVFKCFHCKYTHKSRKQVNTHVKKIHRPKKKCPHCPYRSNSHMKKHILNEHGGQCTKCDFRTSNRSERRNHLLEKHAFICDKCPDNCLKCQRLNRLECRFLHNYELVGHMERCHEPRDQIQWLQCPQCPAKRRHQIDLQEHIKRIHHPDIFKCHICDVRFKLAQTLEKHVKTVHNGEEPPLKCDKCDFKCFRRIVLRFHHVRCKQDENTETFQCYHCNYTTCYKAHLLTHINHNHSSKPDQMNICEFCSFQTKSKQCLKLHVISKHNENNNEEVMRYKCEHCDYKTHRTYNLQIHYLNHKKPEELQYFYCYHCPFKAKRKDNLKSHIFKMHMPKDELKCFICDFKTTSSYSLVKHVDKHKRDADDTARKGTKRKRK
ncbi:zinc finger protein ZFAT-like isoform X2 [Cylas formicarius]|nr:zinc finger protein ZFAT-like isoform X2 [Cylas formicarius]XP_060535479.1 zinc finger protein ZFAT-like isoform X2 [Cylas formicarius]XP_060535480.1 zinc finger protein ZFAT-like isoform X2 [Cylas formicarius]XP_060535481.1 zinc finger protein ZFAT-like isoform X2 [Cylas formicarius]